MAPQLSKSADLLFCSFLSSLEQFVFAEGLSDPLQLGRLDAHVPQLFWYLILAQETQNNNGNTTG